MLIRLAPAVTNPLPSELFASARTVAVVVPSPAASLVLLATSRTIWAPIFSYGSSSSISLATVTPSLVTVGEPNFLSMTTLRPLGPRVATTALESLATPRKIACRACSSNMICFARGRPDDDAFLRFFLGGIGDDNAALLYFFIFNRFNQDAVADRFNV